MIAGKPRPNHDAYLMKLKWARMLGGSEKQYVDALRVFEVQHGRIDEGYLQSWAERLGVTEFSGRIRAEARPLE